MRIEFKGAVLTVDGFNGGFSLTVGGDTVTFAPQGTGVASNATFTYRLQFGRYVDWQRLGSKIPAIKVVRQFLGCGLGEAKAIVEGTETYIDGPEWNMSEFARELSRAAPNTYNVEPCARHKASNVQKFT